MKRTPFQSIGANFSEPDEDFQATHEVAGAIHLSVSLFDNECIDIDLSY